MYVRVGVGLALWMAGATQAQTPLRAERIASGLQRPVQVVGAPGDSTRLFVVERHDGSAGRTGRIRVLDRATGAVEPQPFLEIFPVATVSEQGLLGLAFSPDYETDGFFYVNYTAGGSTVVERYRVSADDPGVADASSGRVVLRITQPRPNHNAGWMGFGPDGMLYIPTGDGGGSCDPDRAAQDGESLLGKCLRIDVSGDDFPDDDLRNYAVPPDNPFVDDPSVFDEVYALGLRNPWRCGFDPFTGDLYLADVGQDAFEEVNVIPAGRGGLNFGWDCREGFAPHSCGTAGCDPDDDGLTDPVFAYALGPGCAIIGGEVYAGCQMPDFAGRYFYSDACDPRVFSGRLVDGVLTDIRDHTDELAMGDPFFSIQSFGTDALGELYFCGGGAVFRIGPAGPTAPDWNGDGQTDFFDVSAYATAVTDQDPAADLDGDGELTFFDVSRFVQAFIAGCP